MKLATCNSHEQQDPRWWRRTKLFTIILLDAIYCCIVKWYTLIVSQYGDLVKQGAEFNEIILHGIIL